MLGAITTEGLGLAFVLARLLKLSGSKHFIVTVVMLDSGSCFLPKPFLEAKFRHDSFISSKRDLIFNMNYLGSSITKDDSTMEHVGFTFTIVSSGKSSRLSDHVLIHRDKIARQIHTCWQISHVALKELLWICALLDFVARHGQA